MTSKTMCKILLMQMVSFVSSQMKALQLQFLLLMMVILAVVQTMSVTANAMMTITMPIAAMTTEIVVEMINQITGINSVQIVNVLKEVCV